MVTPEPQPVVVTERSLAASIEELRVAQSAAEADIRRLHNASVESDRVRRARVIDRQFWFLFAFGVIIFALLAYRTETNSTEIRNGLHLACQARVSLVIQANVGREALVQLALSGPNAPTDPTLREQMAAQLRAGLLLPVETCDPN